MSYTVGIGISVTVEEVLAMNPDAECLMIVLADQRLKEDLKDQTIRFRSLQPYKKWLDIVGKNLVGYNSQK